MTFIELVLSQLPTDECVIWPGKLQPDGIEFKQRRAAKRNEAA